MSTKIKGLGMIHRNGNGATELGLSIMAALSVAGIHSAISPSLFTFAAFSRKPAEQAIARKTLFVSLGASTVASLGILLVFKRVLPAIIAQATGLGLFALGMVAAHSNGVEEPTMAPKPEGFLGRPPGSRLALPKFMLVPSTSEHAQESDRTEGERIESEWPGRSAEAIRIPGGLNYRVGSQPAVMHIGG